MVYSDKHTSMREAIQISPSNLSEGGSIRSPIRPFQHFSICAAKLKNILPHYMIVVCCFFLQNGLHSKNKTLSRALDPHANGGWLSKLTE